jgi:hypothetical protein
MVARPLGRIRRDSMRAAVSCHRISQLAEGGHPREFIGNSSFPVAKACHPCGLRATSPQEVLLI